MSDLSAILHILVAPFSHILVERYLEDNKYIQERLIKRKVSKLLAEDHDISTAENIFSLIATLCVKNLDSAIRNFLRGEAPELDEKGSRALIEFVAEALKDFIEGRYISAQDFLDGNLRENEIWNRLNGIVFDGSGRRIQQQSKIDDFSKANVNLFKQDFSEIEKSIFTFALRSTISALFGTITMGIFLPLTRKYVTL